MDSCKLPILIHLFSILFLLESRSQSISDTTKVLELNSRARSFWRSYPDSSKHLAKEALDLSEKISFADGVIQGYKNLGASYFFSGNYDSAEFFWQKSLDVAISAKNQRGIASGHSSLAIIYQRNQQYLKALEANSIALKKNIEVGDSASIGIILNNTGIIYEEVSDYDKAKEYFKKAIHIREKISDSVRLSSTYLNLGITFMSLKMLDSAELMLSKALTLKKRDNDLWGMANNLGDLGKLHQLKKNHTIAKDYFKQSIDIARKIGAKEIEIGYGIMLANLLIEEGQHAEAKEILEDIYKQIDHQTLQVQVDFYRAYANVNSKQNDLRSATKMWENHVKMLDSLNSINDEKLVLEAQFKLDETLREAELIKENELREMALKSNIAFKKQINITLIVCCVIIGLILLVLLRNYKLLKARNKLLNDQSDQINKLLKKQDQLLQKKSDELLTSKEVINRYAFLNSHELRAPVAKILGVLNVIDNEEVDSQYMINVLSESINEIDQIIRKIAVELNQKGH